MKFASPPNEMSESSKRKDKDWYIANCASLVHGFTTGKFATRYDSAYLKKMRAYSDGTQGNKKVKEKLLRKKDNKFVGRMKDVFDTCDVLPEMLDVIMSINMRATYDISAVAFDESSVKDRNIEKNTLKFMLEQQTKEFLSFTGVKMNNQYTEEDIAGLNDADVEMLYDSGGLQLIREMTAAAVCNNAKEVSGHKTIEDYATKDSVDFAIAGTKVYVDYASGETKYRNVDMQNVMLPNSKRNDFKDITRCGELVWMSLIDVVRQAPELEKDAITELIMMGMNYNPGFNATMIPEYSQGWFNYDNSIFDDFKIPVLDAEWLSTSRETYLELTHSTNGLVRNKVKEDYKLSAKEKKRNGKIDRKKFIKKYEALWVIGTDILLKAEEATHNVYYGPKGNRIPELDYTFQKTGKKSLVDRCVPYVDDINLAEVKLRSSLAKIPPGPRMVIYEHALQNISFGGVRQSREDLLSALEETGYLIVNSKDEKGNINTSNGGKAVEFFPSGLAEDLNIFETTIQSKISRIRQVIGLPEGLDGTSGNPYQGLGKQQLAAAASSNALYPTLSIIGPLFENTFNKVSNKAQSIARGVKGLKVTDLSMSETNARIYELTDEYANAQFKIKLTFAPTDQERADMMAKITEMLAQYAASGGAIGCNLSQYFLLEKLVRVGRLDDARYRVARIEKQREVINAKMKQADIQANQEANLAAAQAKGEEDRANIVAKEEQIRITSLASKSMDGINKVTEETVKSTATENSSISPATLQRAIEIITAYAESLTPQEQAPVAQEGMEQVGQEVPVEATAMP